MSESILTTDFSSDPYWWDAAPRPAPSGSALPTRADVAIVGSGFTGLSAALALARAGRDVVVLEADSPGEGASTRNAGLIGRTVTIPFSTLRRGLGATAAVAANAEGLEAVRFTGELIENEQIQCHYGVSGRFTGAAVPRHYQRLAAELELTRRYASTESRMVPAAEQRAEIGSDHYHGGLLVPGAAELHPGLYHQGLLERASAAGATIVDHTPVVGVSGEPGGFTVATARGELAAGDVVLATNGHTGAATPHFRRRVIPTPAYMAATEPLAPEAIDRLLPTGRAMIDTRNVLRVVRPAPDGSRLLFGGRTGLGERDRTHTATCLLADLIEIFPELEGVRVSHCWQGTMGLTFDRLPHMGKHQGVRYALGHNGLGVPMGTYLGHKIAHRILGSDAGDTVFDGRRFPTKPFYTGRPWFLPATVGWYRLKDALGL